MGNAHDTFNPSEMLHPPDRPPLMGGIDTSDQAIALACMVVTNPGGIRKGDGWQKHVNDLIRALREERNTAHRERDEWKAKLQEQTKRLGAEIKRCNEAERKCDEALAVVKAARDYCDGQMLEGIKALTLVEALQSYDALSPTAME